MWLSLSLYIFGHRFRFMIVKHSFGSKYPTVGFSFYFLFLVVLALLCLVNVAHDLSTMIVLIEHLYCVLYSE
jgi:hypothetical protein